MPHCWLHEGYSICKLTLHVTKVTSSIPTESNENHANSCVYKILCMERVLKLFVRLVGVFETSSDRVAKSSLSLTMNYTS